MTEVQRKYLEWVGYNEYEIQEVENEIKNGEEPLVFEGNQFYAWESGYNKANEFHYCKDGLPEKEKYVLIYTEIENVYMARLVKDDYFITKEGGYVQTSAVIAWKEIILPEIKESE